MADEPSEMRPHPVTVASCPAKSRESPKAGKADETTKLLRVAAEGKIRMAISLAKV